MQFWAVSSTPITAIPELSSGLTPMPEISTPAATNPSSNCGPKMSPPTRPTMADLAPMRAAATAWLAPLPPA